MAIKGHPNVILRHYFNILKNTKMFSAVSGTKRKVKKVKGLSYSEYNFDETEYYFENGLRKVYPYVYTYTTFCKQRWLGQTLKDVFDEEFCKIFSVIETDERIKNGMLLVNDKTVGIDYKLKQGDLIKSAVHRHEFPVLALPIKIIHESDDVLVINKPHSLPVHPTSLFCYNTVLFILAKEFGIKGLHLNHRLDRVTSGVLVLPKTKKWSRDFSTQLETNCIKKTYICKVDGKFPDGDIICDQSMRLVPGRIGLSIIDKNGKHAVTKFKKLSSDEKTSIVLCEPKTGRTHQIRVHLQYLGFPISNDFLYNSDIFGPQKGKNGELSENVDVILNKITKKTLLRYYIPQTEIPKNYSDQNNLKLYSEFQEDILNRYKKDPNKMTYDKNCHYCNFTYRDPKLEELMIFLHALKYESTNWKFETDLPQWALEK